MQSKNAYRPYGRKTSKKMKGSKQEVVPGFKFSREGHLPEIMECAVEAYFYVDTVILKTVERKTGRLLQTTVLDGIEVDPRFFQSYEQLAMTLAVEMIGKRIYYPYEYYGVSEVNFGTWYAGLDEISKSQVAELHLIEEAYGLTYTLSNRVKIVED